MTRQMTTVGAGHDGSLWIAPNSGGVSRLRADGTVRKYGPADGLTGGRVTELLEDRGGTVWVGAPGGLFRLRGDRLEPMGATDVVTSLYEDRQGNLLVGSARSGVLVLQPGANNFATLGPMRTVNSFSEDASGGLWVNDSERGYRGRRLAEKGRSRTLQGPYGPQTGFEDQRRHRAPAFSR
jgi:ligand-binding sensor domain-containing protein